MRNVDKFIDNITSFGNRKAIYEANYLDTYSDLYNKVLSNKKRNQNKNIKSGDVVFILGDYSIESIALFFSLMMNNNIIVPITTDNKEEINERLEVAKPNWVIDLINDTYTFFDENFEIERHQIIQNLIKDKVPGLILFSSGSTGKPKAMVHNLENLISNYGSKKAKEMNFLVFLMFDHIGGLNTLFNCLSMGVSITIPANRNPINISNLIQKNKINVLPASPTFLNLLLISDVFENYDFTSLKMVTYGTEAMPETLLVKLKTKLPHVKFLQTFGTSETGIAKTSSLSSSSTFLKFDDPNQEYKIVDEELWLRSKTQVLGYINHSNDNFTKDGWFKTGDRVIEMSDGFIKIVGRTKEIINVGGEKVMPTEVESVILELESIQDCIVRSEKNAITGQMVCAEVVLKNGYDFKIEKLKIKQYCKQKLDTYKVPARIVEIDAVLFTNRFKKNRQL
jgi:acyl-CoA synthetase (AMP-forming)/AMP-acid ligase II